MKIQNLRPNLSVVTNYCMFQIETWKPNLWTSENHFGRLLHYLCRKSEFDLITSWTHAYRSWKYMKIRDVTWGNIYIHFSILPEEIARKGIKFSQLVPLCCNNIVGLAEKIEELPKQLGLSPFLTQTRDAKVCPGYPLTFQQTKNYCHDDSL